MAELRTKVFQAVEVQPDRMLSLKEVAKILKLSEPRIYQMDDVLEPVLVPRGTKTKTRFYRPEVVERVVVERESNARVHTTAERTMWTRIRMAAEADGFEMNLSLEDFVHTASVGCLFCGVIPEPREVCRGQTVQLHTVIRIVHDHPMSYDNAAPCCAKCLVAKGDMDAREFVTHCRRIVIWHERLGCF
jgi:predicted DNA-binding transcriptional regulator AlpA